MKVLFFLALFVGSVTVEASDCDCTQYPFEPNPPCYSSCIAYFVENKGVDLKDVNNLDPGVYVSVFSLRASEPTQKELEGIFDKSSLQRAAALKLPSKGQVYVVDDSVIDLDLRQKLRVLRQQEPAAQKGSQR